MIILQVVRLRYKLLNNHTNSFKLYVLRHAVRSHIGWRGERSIPYKGVETSPSIRVLKTLRGSPKGKSPKRTIFGSGGLELLQMVSEPVTRRCARD